MILKRMVGDDSSARTTLIDVAYVLGLGFNLYSLYAVQKTQLIVSDASSTHVISTNIFVSA